MKVDTRYIRCVISNETVQQIISQINITDIVGDFVQLKKRGANYLGLCPFHNERTPSFTVSPSKEIYKCFGCGRSGNAISFIMEHDKLSYPEALRWLAKRYHIDIAEEAADPAYKELQQISDSLYIINTYAQKFFANQLLETEMGQAVALSYLQDRGLNNDTIQKFGIGYAPNEKDVFTKQALQQQYNGDSLLKTGLVVNREGQLQDNYRDRIIFPVHNHLGKIIGFGARLIKNRENAPKYINTPENEIYVKSKILYGLYFARHAIEKKDECILVEGYTDVTSLHQAGIENVVASGGTSLTPDQLRLIKRFTKHLTILYDGDLAGIKAALRGLDLALSEGLYVKLVLLPEGEDPDSFAQKRGKVALEQFISTHKKDFILFQAELALQEAQNDSQKKSEVLNKIAESISRIDKSEDFSRQQDYIKKTAALFTVSEDGLIQLVNKFIRERFQKEQRKQQSTQEVQTILTQDGEENDALLNDLILQEWQERALVKCLLLYGLLPTQSSETLAEFVFSTLEGFPFDNEQLSRIYYLYKDWYEAGIEPTEKNFVYVDDDTVRTLAISLVYFPYELSPRWETLIHSRPLDPDERNISETLETLCYFKLRKLKKQISMNEQDLRMESDFEKQIQLLELNMELKKMERNLAASLGSVILKTS